MENRMASHMLQPANQTQQEAGSFLTPTLASTVKGQKEKIFFDDGFYCLRVYFMAKTVMDQTEKYRER